MEIECLFLTVIYYFKNMVKKITAAHIVCNLETVWDIDSRIDHNIIKTIDDLFLTRFDFSIH